MICKCLGWMWVGLGWKAKQKQRNLGKEGEGGNGGGGGGRNIKEERLIAIVLNRTASLWSWFCRNTLQKAYRKDIVGDEDSR